MEQYSLNYKLSLVQEAALLVYIDCIDCLGCSTFIYQVYSAAERILYIVMRDGEKPSTFKRNWTMWFIISNPSYYKVKQKPLEINYTVVTDPIAINKQYKLYYNVINIHQIQDAD